MPGIDFTNDPLLQGRLFSYLDTQLIRLGGPNFHEIPINRPVAPVHNNQRDGHMRQTINRGQAQLRTQLPRRRLSVPGRRGHGRLYELCREGSTRRKIRARSASFFDHFSQATLFFNSQSEPEKAHIVNALRFELGKVEMPAIRERMLYLLAQVDKGLAEQVAQGLGLSVPKKLDGPVNLSIPADGKVQAHQSGPARPMPPSPALSMANTPKGDIRTRKVAFLAADGVDPEDVKILKNALRKAGAQVKIVAPRLGVLKDAKGGDIPVDFSFLTTASVLFDAVFVPGGEKSAADLAGNPDALHFLNEAYKHCKTVGAAGGGLPVLQASHVAAVEDLEGKGLEARGLVVEGKDKLEGLGRRFIDVMGRGRHWIREKADRMPA